MKTERKRKLAALILAVLGVVILLIGLASRLAPPIITGVGFLVLAWALPDRAGSFGP